MNSDERSQFEQQVEARTGGDTGVYLPIIKLDVPLYVNEGSVLAITFGLGTPPPPMFPNFAASNAVTVTISPLNVVSGSATQVINHQFGDKTIYFITTQVAASTVITVNASESRSGNSGSFMEKPSEVRNV